MSYKLRFNKQALKEWSKLDNDIRNQFKNKLSERLIRPNVDSSKVSGVSDCFKIKLRAAGYSLVYQIIENEVIVLVLAVGKREKNAVYKAAIKRT